MKSGRFAAGSQARGARATAGRVAWLERGSALRPRAQAATVPVTISVTKQTDYGQRVRLVGNQPFLGNWDGSKGPSLKWGQGHVWSATINVPVGVDVDFKVVQTDEGTGECEWESGDNRKFKVLGPEYGLRITCSWGKTGSTKIESYRLKDGEEQGKGSSSSAAAGGQQPSPGPSSNGVHHHAGSNGASANGNGRAPTGPSAASSSTDSMALSSLEEATRSTSAWVGGAPQFVRSRKEKGERSGVWNTQGLGGPMKDLVEGDKNASNWLQKLELMKRLLVDNTKMMRPQLQELVPVYVYATWISTGAIACVETGGHHRPNHHANNALQMFRSLEWTIGDAAAGAPGEGSPEARVLAARRLHTRLPSISGEFRVSTPLTRIRDIAHRNDIPKDLKDEIKHTLQNKLHRSAGPEDLVATEAMLARITQKPGQYPEAFINEFRIFTRELREFFNASGLVELLDGTAAAMSDEHKAVATQFKEAMAKLDAAGDAKEPPLDDLMKALFMGTQTRCYYAAGLAAGLRNDVGDNILAMRQRWRLAEIRIEDYVFVLLARLIGALEAAGGAPMLLRSQSTGAWRMAASALTQGLRNMGLSQYATRELLVLENELEAWLSSSSSHDEGARKESALRGKATVERILRLAQQYSDLVMDVYAGAAGKLGVALGVPEHMHRIFGESEVRASVAFQVSRLASLLVRALRAAASRDAWDGLVTGEAVGRLVEVQGLSPEVMEAACKGHNDRVVLLARQATGDEEVGPLGPRLAGVMLRQELPHLSHLGVRARQEKCVFATCDDEDYFRSHIKPLVGKTVKLSVSADSVTLTEAPQGSASYAGSNGAAANGNGAAASNGSGAKRSAAAGATSIASTKRTDKLKLTPLSEATVDTCGSKAAKCAELERQVASASAQTGATNGSRLFSTPPGVALPFGCMEAALSSQGLVDEWKACIKELDSASTQGGALDAACAKLEKLLQGLRLPDSLLQQVASSFKPGSLLAVRSSANVEDLAGLSAAGLYESKVGVPAGEAEALNAAITSVWASLYSRRAVLSRRAAGVSQGDACMAVLIMELVVPDVSFVLHTARPRDSNPDIVLAELAPGQGETLASGTAGTPWRLEINKKTQAVETLAFANFSRALVLPSSTSGKGPAQRSTSPERSSGAGGTAVASAPSKPAAAGGLVEVEIDYSKQRLSTDNAYRVEVGRQLARVGQAIEKAFNGEAQDIEGGLVTGPGGHQVVIFQTRPQL